MKNKKEQYKNVSAFKKPFSENKEFYNRNYLIIFFIIAIITFISYWPSIHNGFVWDDETYVYKNQLLRSFNLREIFSEFVIGNYHPFTILVLAVEYHLFGLNATGYHLVNLLLHLINVLMVFEVVLLFNEEYVVALVAALLFGIHPMHVESVAWISELKDLLYTFFFLISCKYYLMFLANKQRKLYFISLLFFLFSLLSKGMATSLPFVLILIDYFKGNKINRKTLLEKIPFFVLSLVFGIVAIFAQRSSGATEVTVFPLAQRIIFASYSFINYIMKLILPINLSAFNPYPIKIGQNLPAQFYLYPLLLITFLGMILYSLRINKVIFFGVGFFAITIFLVLQLIPIGGSIMSDRYSYIPSIGIFYLAAEGLNWLWKRKKSRYVSIFIFVFFGLFYSIKTYAYCKVWKDGISLWSNVIRVYDKLPMVYLNRGSILQDRERYAEALSDFNKAIEIEPDFAVAYECRGDVFLKQNEYDKAIQDYTSSLKLKPENGNVCFKRGSLLMSAQRFEEAIRDFSSTIRLLPDFVEAYSNRGSIYGMLNRNEEALSDLNKAIELQPKVAKIYYNRGILLKNIKKYNEAISDFSEAINLQPDYPKAYYYKGIMENEVGNKNAACLDLQKAIELGYQGATDSYNSICR